MAVIRESDYEQAQKNIAALIAGGIRIFEITFTTPRAAELIAYFIKNYADRNLVIGAGSICSVTQAHEAYQAGARFLVAPHFDPTVRFLATFWKIDYIPGVSTPTEA